tara:strand:+ start:123 stop:2315 length:2193 start_codon:yes stop_codon:yes gene_type:complete
MKKTFYKSIIILFIILLCAFTYLSTIGISTNFFNSNISKQIKKFDKNLEINLNKIFIILDPIQFKIKLKTVGANIKYDNEEIKLETIKSEVSIKSLLNKEFILKKIEISTKSLEIKNVIKLIRIIQKEPKLYIAEKAIKKGYLIADIDIEFDDNGNLKDNYKIKGIVKDGKINFFKRNRLEAINFIFEVKKNKFQLNDLNLKIENENLRLPETIVEKKNNQYLVSGKMLSNQITLTEKRINDYFDLKNINFKIKEIIFSSENNFNFSLNNKFKIKDLKVSSKVNLVNLEIKNDLNLKNFFPKIENKFFLKDNQLQINYKKNSLDISGLGNIFLQKKPDKIKYRIIKNKDDINFDTKLYIKDNNLKLDFLNFEKKDKSNLRLEIEGQHKINKGVLLKKINLIENKNSISINDLSLSYDNKINNIKNITLNYQDQDNLKNSIQITKKNKNYFITGDSLNINQIIDNLINSKNKKKYNLFKNDFKINIKIDQTYLDKNNIMNNLKGYLKYNNNKIYESKLESSFSNNKKIRFTVNTDNGVIITTLYTDVAKPFVDRYKFIKGFDEGNLDFYSTKKNDISNSTLKIDNFKVQEVPILAKLLTLASLQGIADLLTGEGIRFTDFEMKFSNQKKLMRIEEMYAIGPAISILMDGYIEQDKLISLRGTLVPATTINRTISSIPLVGKILVGKKVGEGVFGVSFKIKGPSEDLKTTVNPIKTLTPRFITRTLEKIKKN